MISKHITRDYSAHRKNIIRPYDEHTKLEIFSFDPQYTKIYLAEDKTLKTGENFKKASWKSWTCYCSANGKDDMSFNINYDVKESATYRIDIVYEKNNAIHSNKKLNTGKNLLGHLTITNPSDTIVLDSDYSFGGVNNITKRKNIFQLLNKGKHKINIKVPPNCYMMGVIIRKVIKYVGDNYYGSNLGSEDGTLAVTKATVTNSSMTKPTELSATILYDDALECNESPSGFYIDYHDEVNFYVKDDNGDVQQIFGGYVSSILPNADRTELTLACADRMIDSQNKYLLDQIVLQGGSKSTSEDEYTSGMTRQYDSYPKVLHYLCNCHELTLANNISKDYTVDGEKYHKGFSVDFGSSKKVKKIEVTNGYSTPAKNYITIRNKSDGDKKQVWKLYDAKNYAKQPIDITDYGYLHITYGLGGAKTEYKTKTTETVDVSDTTAGSQKFGKCGVSADGKYVMSICQPSGGKRGKFKYNTIYKTVFKNKCPRCGKATLRWDSGRKGTNCITCGGYNGSKRSWGNISEGEVSCNSCCSDFDGVTGYEKDGKYSSKLTKASSTVQSSKAEQTKLFKGEMRAVPTSAVEITPTSIFKAIAKLCKKYKYKRGSTGQTYAQMKKTGYGDCWGFSDLILSEFKRYKVKARVYEYETNASKQHRSVRYLNSSNKWVDFPYKDYGLNKNLYPTSKINTGRIVDQNKTGSHIGNAKSVSSTSKSQTTTVTSTKGFDKDKPFQAYLLLTYSLSQDFKAKSYNVGIKFTLDAPLQNSINNGLPVYWINNKIKKTTLRLDNNKNLIDYLKSVHGENNRFYLQSLQFIAPKKKATKENEDIDYYKSDNSTNDNSSCKMKLYQISFDDDGETDQSELNSCGKSIISVMDEIVKESGYYVDMTYGLHRKDDKINFRVANQSEESYTATEGDNNNILSWNSISYSPISSLYNISMVVYKDFNNTYKFIDTKDSNSVMQYGEQCTLATSSTAIGDNEAYFNATQSDKYNPVQTYNFTITVPNMPRLRIGDLVKVVANAKKLNTVKEVQSIKVTFDYTKMPRIQTELGLGELSPDIQLKQNIRQLRQSAKEKTTSFSTSAIAVTDSIYYEWDK